MKIILFLFCICILSKIAQGKCPSLTSVIPSNQNSWARQYSGQIYRFLIKNQNSSSVSIQFLQLQKNTTHTVNSALPCTNQSLVAFNLTLECEKDLGNLILTIVTTTPLTIEFNNMKISLSIDSELCYSVHLTIKDCPWQVPGLSGLFVQSPNKTYNSVGTFDCLSVSAMLFYKNSTLLKQKVTSCQSNATWVGQEMIQCWQAPVDTNLNTMNGLFVTMAGHTMNLNCTYSDVIPIGNETKFYLNNRTYTLPKGELFSFNVTPQPPNQWTSCQAVTPYTKIYTDAGKSNYHSLFVAYPPYRTNAVNISCIWNVNQFGSCNVSFYANPPNSTAILTKNGHKVPNEAKQSISGLSIEQTFHFVRLLVERNDTGSYLLNITSNAFLNSHLLVPIEIYVMDASMPTSNPAKIGNIGAIVGGCIGGFFAVLVFAAVGLYCHRNHNIYFSKGSSSALDKIHSGPSGSTNMALDDDFYIQPNDVVIHSKHRPPMVRMEYANLHDNVNVSFDDSSYIELSPVEPQIHSAQSQEYEPVIHGSANIPMYESIPK